MNFQAGGESGKLIKTRKQAVMAVRLLVLVVLGLAVRYHPLTGGLSYQLILLLGLFAISNIAFWFVQREQFESRRSYSLILLFDVGMISLVAALMGTRNPEFFTVFFLTVLASAMARRISLSMGLSAVALIVFVVLHASSEGVQALMTHAFFLRLILLFVTALLAGYIAEALEAERQIAIQSNPTTGLPGYSLIRNEIEKRIAWGRKFAVCYIDNDNFKAYNDYYGYARGDGLIKATGRVITDAVRKKGNPGDFIGHVGGDDFLAITTPDKVNDLSNEINVTFGSEVKKFYDKSALERGFIKSHDRKGETAIFPVMGLSIAVISNEKRDITSPDQIAEIAAQLKKKAKSHKSRMYVTGDTTAQRTYKEIEAAKDKQASPNRDENSKRPIGGGPAGVS